MQLWLQPPIVFLGRYLWHGYPTVPNEDGHLPSSTKPWMESACYFRPKMASFLYSELPFCTSGFCLAFPSKWVFKCPLDVKREVKCFQIQNWQGISFLLNRLLGLHKAPFSFIVKYLSYPWPHICLPDGHDLSAYQSKASWLFFSQYFNG